MQGRARLFDEGDGAGIDGAEREKAERLAGSNPVRGVAAWTIQARGKSVAFSSTRASSSA